MNATRVIGVLALALVAVVAIAATASAQTDDVTFHKDVEPILQQSCQRCHRPGAGAPMSLMTFQDTRPWARSIKNRVVNREMPPWHLDPTVGITAYIDDPSLTEEQIATVAAWVDAGAPRGNPDDAPAAIELPALDAWQFGEPDLVVENIPIEMPAACADQYPNPVVETGLTQDEWIQWVQFMPGDRRVVHHSMQYAIQDDPGLVDESLSREARGSGQGAMLVEYAVGNQGDFYPPGSGRLLMKDSQIRFSGHYHCIGEATTDVSRVGMKFHPKEQEPTRRVISFMLTTGVPDSETGLNELSIPPHTVARHDRYFRLEKPAQIITFQPHMHYLGKSMKLEVVHLDGKVETLTDVKRYDFNWQISYNYQNPPVYPAGSFLHIVSEHDNTSANRYNTGSVELGRVGWPDRGRDGERLGRARLHDRRGVRGREGEARVAGDDQQQ